MYVGDTRKLRKPRRYSFSENGSSSNLSTKTAWMSMWKIVDINKDGTFGPEWPDILISF